MGEIVDVTDATFAQDVIRHSATEPVVVDFWAAWCAPCRALGPVLEKAVSEHGGVRLAKLDTDANQQTAMEYGIRGIPAVKGFRDGNVVAEFVGLQPRQAVEQFLAQLAPTAARELPADEKGLSDLLTASPENVDVRRALGTLLLNAGRIDEADGILSVATGDRICEGLRARIALVKDGDESMRSLPADPESVAAIIARIPGSSGTARDNYRKVAIGLIELLRDRHPDVEAMRSKLAAALL